MESKLCGSYHFGKQTLWVVGCRRKPTWVDGLTLEVKSKLCRWSHHRGFHVSRALFLKVEGLKIIIMDMESKLCGSYHCRGCILFELSNFVEECHCRGCIVFELSNFEEDVFQGFKVLDNMKRKLRGFYIIWKANFVGLIQLCGRCFPRV